MLLKCQIQIFVILSTIIIANGMLRDLFDTWNTYKAKFEKRYNKLEEIFRGEMFANNFLKIESHNKLYSSGNSTYKMGVNKFTDMTVEEVAHLFSFSPASNTTKMHSEHNHKLYQASTDGDSSRPRCTSVPERKDWREVGAVSRVKDQGKCGACWAFSTTGALETKMFLKTKRMVTLSEQNLMDCSKNYGNMGCNGGNMAYAYEYLKDGNGIDTDSKYPYEARDTAACRYRRSNSVVAVADYYAVKENERSLKQAVACEGTISGAIHVTPDLLNYVSGIFYDRQCNPRLINHAILIVGYGEENGQDYWIVKNSWGPDWGEDGYFRLARNERNHCGIASDISFPVL